jgi:chromosome segregation protein
VFLRSLTLRGFKSFADRTTLEFTPGISVIVGPNGSGKSNVADAIAWVLGEQGPRAMRSGQMADVIFAGSPSRPALGMADVSMVIDNHAGLIPVPATEIEISRTIYRSGDSEYRLGGRPCRLLDIQELLSDTGVGRALHTIIGQGHLEDVLSARPEERRQLVEEAAGIAKHRRRRERAERKLAGLEQDLLRLQDVLAELRRHLKPLRQQAELARRHESLALEATVLARRLAAVRLRDLHRDREIRLPAWRDAEARQARARERLSELDARIERLDRERGEAEAIQRRAEEDHSECVRARAQAEAAVREALRSESEARERLSAAAGRSARLFAMEEELDRTVRALAQVGATMEEREAELEEAERAFRILERARRDAEDERRRVEAIAATRRIEADALRRTEEALNDERGRLTALMRDLRSRGQGAALRAEELERKVEHLDEQETPLAREQASLERERGGLAHSLGDLEVLEKGLLARQEVIDARRIEVADSPGAAFARRRGGRPLGVLRDLISVPPDLKTALRAALGSLADAVVYPTRDMAMDDVEAESGGITLLPAAGQGEDAPRSPPTVPGARPILEMVRPDPRTEDLVRRLLADVHVVHNVGEARARHRVHPDATFVTRDGVVLGGSFARTAVGGDARLEKLRRDSAAIERELSSVRRSLREGRRRLHEVEARAEVVRAELARIDGEITESADRLADARAEAASAGREEALVLERLQQVEESIRAVDRTMAGSVEPLMDPPPLPPVPEPPVHLRVEVEALRRERSRLEGGVVRARRELERLSAEDPATLRSRLEGAERDRAEQEEHYRHADAQLDRALEEYRAATEAARRAQTAHAEANRAWREQAAAVEELRAGHEQEDRARGDLERRIAEAERLLVEGHGADPAEAMEALAEDDSVETLQRQSDLVARRLGLVGKVNLLAAGELESVQERHDFLARELEDVRRARRDLRELIEEVDRQVEGLFDAAFRDVAREFSALFATLFPGGEGRLTLTDPGDLLGAGIDIEARPGGKRVKRLSLLSGGERSLAALGFLFAIFRARPSPFYLMDEVEAALDDVNLSRFLEVVKGFAEVSQILVVTHQKRTMEAADVLYGVSMGTDGASRVISQRLAEVAAP